MLATTKLAAIVIIAVGGALVGAMGGWNFGPLTLELTRVDLVLFGTVGGVTLALTGCCFASEYEEARARNRIYLTTLRRLARIGNGVRLKDSRRLFVNPVSTVPS